MRKSKIPVMLYGNPEDAERIAALREAADLEKVESTKGNKRGGDAPSTEALDAYNAALDEVAAEADQVWVQHIGGKFRELKEKHPPRYVRRLVNGEESDVIRPEDAEFGVNASTFPKALLLYKDQRRATIADPLPTDAVADLEDYLDDLSDGNFNLLYLSAHLFNSEQSPDPKEFKLSEETPSSSKSNA